MLSIAERTINSLKKINDFPFYYGKYYGDYKITDFINGSIKSNEDVIPFFEKLLSDQGIEIKLSFPKPPDIGIGCSAFFINSNQEKTIIGKNLDWKQDPLLLLKTTPSNHFSSISMVNLNFCDFFNLGSLEYNLLLSPYVPLDGMNEKGLVVSMLSVHEGASYPINSNKISVGDFNIIRIVLDTCSTIEEAISVFKKYNIMQTGALPLHYLIANKDESCIIELFDGEIQIYRDDEKNYLTNFLCLKKSTNNPIKEKCSRYEVLKNALNSPQENIGLKKAKELLKKTSVFSPGYQLPSTIWSIIYIPEDLEMKIKIGQYSQYYTIKYVD